MEYSFENLSPAAAEYVGRAIDRHRSRIALFEQSGTPLSEGDRLDLAYLTGETIIKDLVDAETGFDSEDRGPFIETLWRHLVSA